ncbi:MAG: 2-oxo acid dehydrogenase subunit E2 [Spirochaetota bacterium]
MPWRRARVGEHTVRRLSFERRLVAESLSALPAGHNFMALLELDVTSARATLRALRRGGSSASLFAYLVKTFAVTLTRFPELNAIPGRRGIVEFKEIDVSLPVELATESRRFPRQIVIRDAANRRLEEIADEVALARASFEESRVAGRVDAADRRTMRLALFLPGFVRRALIRSLTRDPFTVKRRSGTTFVTSVSSSATGDGFIVPYMAGPKAVSLAIGPVTRRAKVVGDEIVIRQCASVTLTFNHDLVDGAPAARFAARFRKAVEDGEEVANVGP